MRRFLLLVAICSFTSSYADQMLRSSFSSMDLPPCLGCWFWHEGEFETEGYRPMIDVFVERSPYTVLTTSLRVPKREVTDPDVRSQIKAAAVYARDHGLGMAVDLDVRLARRAFAKRYPDELQQMVRLREIKLTGEGTVELRIPSEILNDHYTHRAKPYVPLEGKLLRVYSYRTGKGSIEAESVREMSKDAYRVVRESSAGVRISFQCGEKTAGRTACAVVSFTHFAPAVFAPHLLEFQREIIRSYSEVPLVGVCKDEWGFPPCYDGCPEKNDYWYSSFRGKAYAGQTVGRDLLRDFLLMTFGETGKQQERQVCINHFLEMSRLRNGEIEQDFYEATKEVFGPEALVATHPTWYPFPGVQEFKKNGLDWWIAKRDWAQTDEVTPFCARTSLAKKWNSPVWYNMYYSQSLDDYWKNLWVSALGGGRLNVHPMWPTPEGTSREETYSNLLGGDFVLGSRRVRLLDWISKSPLDCPVAVIFGQACAMNWAGPSYGEVGVELADALWQAGYPTDLIPAAEVSAGALKINEEGLVQYGPQSYQAAILYNPEFENPSTAAFFEKASHGPTTLFRIGEWTTTFEGKDYDGVSTLPAIMAPLETVTDVGPIIESLRSQGVPMQTPAIQRNKGYGYESAMPPTRGQCRLVDGTVILVSASEEVSGDTIQETLDIEGNRIRFDAQGVFALRFDGEGNVEAFAAGGLARLETKDLSIQLDERVDLAYWKEEDGNAYGVLEGWDEPVPPPLQALTTRWTRTAKQSPLTGK